MSILLPLIDQTRVVIEFGDFSIEFCGGTHVPSTGQIGLFKILSESSVAAGVRRIEAITGRKALTLFQNQFDTVEALKQMLKCDADQLVEAIERLAASEKGLGRELEQLHLEAAGSILDRAVEQASELDGLKVAVLTVQASNLEVLKDMGSQLRGKLQSGVGVLGSVLHNKVMFVSVVTDDLAKSKRLDAGQIVKQVAKLAGGSGGGKPHLATAGAKDVSKLSAALEAAPGIVAGMLKVCTNPIRKMIQATSITLQ